MKRELFIDEFIVPFTPLTELEGIAQGYAIIKTAEDLENIANQSYQYPFNIKLLLLNNISYIDKTQLLFIGGCELNGNGNTITTNRVVFVEIGAPSYELCSCINLKVSLTSTIAQPAIAKVVLDSVIDNCIIDIKHSQAGKWGGITDEVWNSTIKNCNVRIDSPVNGSPCGAITNLNRHDSSIENCFIEIKLNHYGFYAYFGSIAYESVASTIKNCTAIMRGNVVGGYYNYSMHLCPVLQNDSIILESECYFKMENDG